jgi:predicted transcriptional regulator
LETDIEVLKAISAGDSHPTLIMQRTKFSWNTIVATLHSLLRAQAIAFSIPKNYVLTEKGERILSNYDAVKEGLGSALD